MAIWKISLRPKYLEIAKANGYNYDFFLCEFEDDDPDCAKMRAAVRLTTTHRDSQSTEKREPAGIDWFDAVEVNDSE